MTNDELLARLDERMKAMDEKMEAIYEQTLKTNGRLTRAEQTITDLKLHNAEQKGQWRGASLVGGAVGSIIGGLIAIFSK